MDLCRYLNPFLAVLYVLGGIWYNDLALQSDAVGVVSWRVCRGGGLGGVVSLETNNEDGEMQQGSYPRSAQSCTIILLLAGMMSVRSPSAVGR